MSIICRRLATQCISNK